MSVVRFCSIFALSLAGCVVVCGCGMDGDRRTVTVDSRPAVFRHPLAQNSEFVPRVRREGDDDWRVVEEGIDGFEPKWGVISKIEIEYVQGEPVQDSENDTTIHERTISRTPVSKGDDEVIEGTLGLGESGPNLGSERVELQGETRGRFVSEEGETEKAFTCDTEEICNQLAESTDPFAVHFFFDDEDAVEEPLRIFEVFGVTADSSG